MKDSELLNIIKNDMGLKGKGMSAGKKVYKKGGIGFKDLLKIPATIVKSVFPPAALPLKMVGLGKKQKQYGSGLFDIFKIPLKLVGLGANGEYVEVYEKDIDRAVGMGMSGGCSECGDVCGGNIGEVLKLLITGQSLPYAIQKSQKKKQKKSKKGKGITGGAELGTVELGRVRRVKGEGMGSRPTRDNMPGSDMSGGKKRGRPSKKGGSFLSTIADIANISPFTNSVMDISPLSQLVGKKTLQNAAASMVEKQLGLGITGGKKKAGRPKKEKQPKQRKVNSKMANRSKLVKKIMNEKGVSMIEASKLIKQHNLKY
jgi:hypothetical protein